MLWLAGKQVGEAKKVEESKSRKVEELTSTPRLLDFSTPRLVLRLTLSNPDCPTERLQIHSGFAGKVSTKEAVGGGHRGG